MIRRCVCDLTCIKIKHPNELNDGSTKRDWLLTLVILDGFHFRQDDVAKSEKDKACYEGKYKAETLRSFNAMGIERYYHNTIISNTFKKK